MPQNLTGLCAEPISVLLRSTQSIAETTTASGSTLPTLLTPGVTDSMQKDVAATTTPKATLTTMERDVATDLVMAGARK